MKNREKILAELTRVRVDVRAAMVELERASGAPSPKPAAKLAAPAPRGGQLIKLAGAR